MVEPIDISAISKQRDNDDNLLSQIITQNNVLLADERMAQNDNDTCDHITKQ